LTTLVSYAYRYSFRAAVATKGKLAAKSKAITASSSRPDDENDSDAEQHIEENSEEVGDPDEDGGDMEPESEPPNQATSHNSVRDASSLDETAAIALFNDYRQFGSYMMGLSSRLKTMLANIKVTADPTTRLLTLQELSELLSISTEDTLAGSFQVEQFVRELVRILGGPGAPSEDDDDGDDDPQEREEDAALAAALALSTGNITYQGDENLEAQVLACRCLANLMEALPGVAHTVVYHGAIPVLCSKLVEISYIDLAEQTLSVSIILLTFWRFAQLVDRL
jgi:E3 ubiquitin-protein ligase TRIP12